MDVSFRMNQIKVEVEKKNLLQRLKEVGAEGITKSNLCGSSKIKTEALKALLQERKIFNLGSKARACFVLPEHYRPLERAYEELEKIFNSNGLKLISKGKIEKIKEIKKYSSVNKHVNEALDILIQEQKVLKLKTANYFSYIGVKPIVDSLDLSGQTTTQEPPIDTNEYKQQINEAYRKLSQQSGFSAVEIYNLHKETGIPLDWIKEYILTLRKEGKAEFNFGDWSLSSKETRLGAVEFDGDRFLLVRLLS